MSTDQSTNLGLPFLMPAQAQKHVTVNESLTRLDALVQLTVQSRSVSVEPASPGDGQVWIAPAGKTGAAWDLFGDWSLAYYRDGAWEQLSPKPGWRAYVADESRILVYDGTEWRDAAPSAPAGYRNAIINGGFDVWRRGTSFSGVVGALYTADRWQLQSSDATMAASRQAFAPGQTEVPGEPAYFFRMQSISPHDNAGVEHKIEDVRTLAGRRALISFYAKSDAPRTMNVLQRQNFGAGGSAQVQTATGSVSLTTEWRRFALAADWPSISGKTLGASHYISLLFNHGPATPFTIDLACVSMEAWPEGAAAPPADMAPPFERRPLGVEEALCRRYFERLSCETNDIVGCGYAVNVSLAVIFPTFAPKRAAPSLVFSDITKFDVTHAAGASAATALSSSNISGAPHDRGQLNITTAGILVPGQGVALRANTAGQHMDLSAEL